MSDTNSPIILFHAHCLDGFGAAYAAWKYFGDNASYFPVSYGDSIEHIDTVGKDIYIVDFSFPPEQVAKMLEVATNVTIIDHHKTFIDAVESDGYCNENGTPWERLDIHYDLNKSGAVLTWEFCHDEPVPMLLGHIQDRDLWQFKLNGTKEICAALSNKILVDRSFDYWDFLVHAFDTDDLEVMHDTYAKGRAVIATQEMLIQECMATASKSMVDEFGINIVQCNAPASIASELGNRLAEQHPDCIAVIYSNDHVKQLVKCSLRSVGDVDCTVLAKKFGGGGHKNAAGFTTTTIGEAKTK
jgi:oligoribonuclease NrnB/cAMP/cGMP phosphodiesterase (DHH superfamily)